MYNNIQIPVYAINLKSRPERLLHIQKEFENKPEFCLHIVEACEHKIGAVGLWQSMVKCVNMAIENDDDVMIICEDDHCFTPHYNKQHFIQHIIDAGQQGCEILSAGVGEFTSAIRVAANRYWIKTFWCTQFIVIYKSFFKTILNEPIDDKIIADMRMTELTAHKMVIYPFMSVQKDFGYSDCTVTNNVIRGKIEQHFDTAKQKMMLYQTVHNQYSL